MSWKSRVKFIKILKKTNIKLYLTWGFQKKTIIVTYAKLPKNILQGFHLGDLFLNKLGRNNFKKV